MTTEKYADVVIVGAGAAGLSLARRLAAPSGGRGVGPDVLVVEPPPGPVSSPPRTWCFWDEEDGEWDDLVAASWSGMRVRGRDGQAVTAVSPRPYKMLRSADFLTAVESRLAEVPGVARLTGTVTSVTDAPGQGGYAEGTDAGGRPFRVHGRWVFDSRPPRRLPPARTTLWQHFQGWFVRTSTDRFDPQVADLMDFRTPQPACGVSFAYVLPLSTREALVEYTEFSPSLLRPDDYTAALRHYTRTVRPLGDFQVITAEHGVIPMTDGRFPRRHGTSVFPLGAAAGAIRPATGYAFAALQRQTAGIAAALHSGRTPLPPPVHARRHLFMDAALLRALAAGRLDGAAFFTGLFRRNPWERISAFLEGRSGPLQEWLLGLRSPVPPMLRSVCELPLLPRRPVSPPPVSGPHRKTSS